MNTTNGIGLLTDKVVFISGAGRGIGAAAARLFAREGARVMLAARTEAQLAAVVDEVIAAGGHAEFVVCDLADSDSVRAAVDQTVKVFGRVDAAFNNGTTLTEMIREWETASPGVIDRLNADTPLRRGADPAEVAEAAAWLLSDRASYVTGAILRVDGGAGV